jgi:hypothetical protein
MSGPREIAGSGGGASGMTAWFRMIHHGEHCPSVFICG